MSAHPRRRVDIGGPTRHDVGMPTKTDARPHPRVRTAKTKLGGVAVVCAKCAKRQGVRPRAVRALVKEAYREIRGPGSRRRKLRVLESGCLGPCPKRAVALATGASLAAGRVILLDPLAGAQGARAALLPEFGPNADLEPGSTSAARAPAAAPADESSRSP